MNKTLLTIAFIIAGLFFFGNVQEARAGTVFMRSVVSYDSQSRKVGGISATYVTYDIYDYYDPGVYGELYYLNPVEYLDNDGGIGTNDYLFGYYPGFRVSFTTNDYRPNKILCTISEHGLRRLYSPALLQHYDPYRIDSVIPGDYGAEYDLPLENKHTGDSPETDFYTEQGSYRVVGYTSVCIQTPTVASVSFETINSIVEDIGGDKRIFPDLQTLATDEPNRKIVRVKAKLTNSEQGVEIHFRNYDVDDPSGDPIIDSNGNAGGDNWGNVGGSTAGRLNAPSAKTDSNGEASVELTVTMQPGDNFVIAASTDPDYLIGVTVNGTGLQDSAGNQLSSSSGRARRTNLLTVWRRLHIEVDSMGAAQGNFVVGNIASGRKGSYSDRITLTLNVSLPLEPNRFENGLLVIGTDSYRVIPNEPDATPPVDANTGDTVTIINDSGFFSVRTGTQFVLYDDDDFNASDGLMKDGDTGEDIDEPDRGFMTANSDDPNANIYAPAYIHPVYDIGDNNGNTLFAPNVSDDTGQAVRDLFDFDQIATEASEEFWTAYLLGGYQYTIAEDDDPETEPFAGTLGATDVQNGVGSIVFMETNGPVECTVSPDFCSIADTSAHEIGHLLNADEGDGGIMDGIGHSFSPTSLNKIRRTTHP